VESETNKIFSEKDQVDSFENGGGKLDIKKRGERANQHHQLSLNPILKEYQRSAGRKRKRSKPGMESVMLRYEGSRVGVIQTEERQGFLPTAKGRYTKNSSSRKGVLR